MSSGYIAAASFAQRQLRYLDILQPDRAEYAVPLIIEISGDVDTAALSQALQAVVDRHDVLRAALPLVDDVPVQAVRDHLPLKMPIENIAATSREHWCRQVAEKVNEMVAQGFDMTEPPLIAAVLLVPNDAVIAKCSLNMAVVFHHAIADGGSLPLFLQDLVCAYDAATTGLAPAWDDLPLQYSDYADWEQDNFANPDAPALAEAMAYWQNALRGVAPLMDLPLDHPRPPPSCQAGKAVRITLPAAIGDALSATARAAGTTPFIAFLAVFYAVLHRWSANEDLVITVPVSKRTRSELAQLIGLLVDTLPLRVSCDPGKSFEALLESVQSTFREGVAHRDTPFQQIVQSINIERKGNTVPLMQVLFGSLEDGQLPITALDGARFEVIDDHVEQTAKGDLSVVYRHTAQHLELWCRYDAALFESSTIQNLLAWFGSTAEAVAQSPQLPVGRIPLIDEASGRALIKRFNDTRRPYPADQSIIALFDRIAANEPLRPAIEHRGRRTSYGELACWSERLTRGLVNAGCKPGDTILVSLPLSADFIAVVLAILRLGGTYMPVDPTHPATHRARLASTAHARIAVVSEGRAEDIGDIPNLLCHELNASGDSDAGASQAHAPVRTQSGDPAYVMFTSGSTGEPKGVAISHRAIVRLVRGNDYATFGPHTRSAVYSNPSFDASTLEIWAPLLNGGTAVIIEREAVLNVTELRRTLQDESISLLWITAGLFHEIAGIDPSVFAGDRLVITGGDTVNPDAARSVLRAAVNSQLRLLNGYGPTENTTFSTCFDMAALPDDSLSVPIGRPIANSTVYVLDPNGQPLPVGVTGEIYVGGDGVALGYVGDPERSATSFLPDPFIGGSARMYRSGDYGRWSPDGTLLFAGRSDDQVKVRGFRIELNEIATALLRHPSLRAVHVAAPRLAAGERQIIAYVAPNGAPGPASSDLRQFLEALLPSHMLPQAYVTVDALALNQNGKIDRKALPSVEVHHFDRSEQAVAPRNEKERCLHAIWKKILGLDIVGIHDNFFHIGGDSILAIRMAARAGDAGLKLTPADIFKLQTIAQLAEALVIMRPPQRRIAAEQVFPAELVPLASHTHETQPFILVSLEVSRPIAAVELAMAIQHLAERHEALRLRWVHDKQTSRLEIMAYVAQLPIRIVDVPDLNQDRLDDWVKTHAARIGRGLDTQNGVVVAATLVDRGARRMPIVILALHRAVADERSALTIAAELGIVLGHGHAVLTDHTDTTAFGEWLEWLGKHADAQAAGEGLTVLEDIALAHPSSLSGPATIAERDEATTPRVLDQATSRALTSTVPATLAITLLDALAAALSAALNIQPHDGPVLIETVDAERCLPSDAPSVAGMVGNLDSIHLVTAPIGAIPMARRLRSIKMERQRVASTSGVWRVLGQTFALPAATVGISRSPTPDDHSVRLHSLPTFSTSVRDILAVRETGTGLSLSWVGSKPSGDVRRLLDAVEVNLRAIVDLALHHTAPLYTHGDFPLAKLSQDSLSTLIGSQHDITDIYPLSPMQESMLVHGLAAARSEVNFEQSCMRIKGVLDQEAFRHAWATVFQRHDVLRTSFHWRGLPRPLQVVHHRVPLPMTADAWPCFDAQRLEEFLAADRRRGFQLEQAPLVRLHLVQVAPDDVYVISSFHHLLVDGWCLGRIEREVRAAYETYRSGRPPLFDAPVPFRSYIAWLEQVDQRDNLRFFTGLLKDLPARRRLCGPAKSTASSFSTAHHALDVQASRALQAFARRRGLTLAAVLHFAWAVWLGARLGTDDVMFGTTVSGRPSGIPGVERIVGLFINNLPVRLHLADMDTVSERMAAMQTLLVQLQSHAHLSPAMVAEAGASGADSRPLFDTLVVVENLASGTSAWTGAEGLSVESTHTRLKTAYDLTFVALPGDCLVLSLVQPNDGRKLENLDTVLEALGAILRTLPNIGDGPIQELPRPEAVAETALEDTLPLHTIQLKTRPRSTTEARIADTIASLGAVQRCLEETGQIDLDTDFWEMGLNSLELVQLSLRLGQSLERSIPISLLLEHRTIASLAQAIESGQHWSPIVPMSRAGTHAGTVSAGEPLVCIHPVAGDVSVFLDLAYAMPPEIPFWAVQAAGLEVGQTPLNSVEALARYNLDALAQRGLDHPRHLGGYSFGGIVAFEMARQLAQSGQPPAHVIIMDTPAPLEASSILPTDPDQAHALWLVRMGDVRARFQGLEPVLSFDEVLATPAAQRFEFAVERLHAARLLPLAADAAWLERAHRTSLVQYDAYLSYRPPLSAGADFAISLIRARSPQQSDLGEKEHRQLVLPDLGWQAFTREPVRVRYVDGDHVTMLSRETAAHVAREIASLMEQCGTTVDTA